MEVNIQDAVDLLLALEEDLDKLIDREYSFITNMLNMMRNAKPGYFRVSEKQMNWIQLIYEKIYGR